MNSRRVGLLGVAAVIVLAAAALVAWLQRPVSVTVKNQALLADLKPALDQVTELRIARADGSHVTLKKQDGEWTVHERDYPADGGKLRKLLLDLSSLQVLEEKTSNPQLYSTINVEDVQPVGAGVAAPSKAAQSSAAGEAAAATRVDVVTPQKTWSVLVGKSSGYKEGYVRLVGAKQSYLASPHIEAEVQPQQWVEHTITDIGEARIQSVAVKPAKGPAYTVSREKKEDANFKVSNIPSKRKLSAESAGNTLARGLEALSLDDLRNKPETTTAVPAGTTVELSQATYKTFDGVTVEVSGRKESAPGANKDDPKVEKHFITLTASSDQKATQAEAAGIAKRVAGKEFEISSYKYEAMFKPLEDLLEPLPVKKDSSKKKD